METEYLREFIAVAQELNFSSAARSLNMSQSTLSRHISALEREFDAQFLDRTKTYVRLTPEGQYFLQEASAILDAYDRLRATFAEESAADSLTIAGHIGDSFTSAAIEKAVAQITSANPKARIHLDANEELNALEPCIEALSKKQADCVIVTADAEEAFDGRPDLDYRTIGRLSCGIAIPANHPLAKIDRPMRIEDLAGTSLIHLLGTEFQWSWSTVQGALDRANLMYALDHRMARSSLDVLTMDLKGSILIFPFSSILLSNFQARNDVAIRSFDEKDGIALPINAIYRPDDASPLLGAFLDALR